MNRCRWESPRAKFGIEHIEDGQNRYYFNTDMAEKGRPMKETAHPEGGAASRAQMDREVFLKDIYPLHCESERAWLQEHWGSFKLMFNWHYTLRQPLEPIRRYYGTQVGLYFAWLELYTKALLWPAAAGVVLWCQAFITDEESTQEMGHWLLVSVQLWIGCAALKCLRCCGLS